MDFPKTKEGITYLRGAKTWAGQLCGLSHLILIGFNHLLCIGAELGSRGMTINRLGDPLSIFNLDIGNLEILFYNEEPEAQRWGVVAKC